MPDNFIPYYKRIIDDITADIAAGRLKPGARIQSTAQLADKYGVSQGTVRHAIETLIDRGILVGHQGLAVSVASPGEKTPE